MKKWRISRIYVQIVASFLCVIFLASAVLVLVSVWFFRKNEESFLEKGQVLMETGNRRMKENLEIICNIENSLLLNRVVKDNLRVSEKLTAEHRYYHVAIVDMLGQANIQMDDLIDSIFLYVDDQRVLYSAQNLGTSDFEAFFERMFVYKRYDSDFWRALLGGGSRGYVALAPDSYASFRVNDNPVVIPLVYHAPGVGCTNVLVMNISCEAILRQYQMESLSDNVLMALFTQDGEGVLGCEGLPDMETLLNQKTARVDGREYFVFDAELSMLGLSAFALVPMNALADITAYYRVSMLLLLASFTTLGVVVAVMMSRRAYAPIQQVHESIGSIPDVNAVHSLNNEIEVIRSAISRLADERELYRERDHQHSYHYIMQGVATLLDGNALNDGRYFSSLLSREYRFRMRGFRCADILVDAEEEGSFLSRAELMTDVRDRLRAAFEDGAPMISVMYQSNMLVLLIDSDGGDEMDIRDRLKRVHDGLDGICGLRIGLGNVVDQLSLLPSSFEQANSEVFAIPAPLSPMTSPAEFVYDRSDVFNAANTRDIKRIEDEATEILTNAKQSAVSYAEAVGIMQDIRKIVVDAQRSFDAQIPICDRSGEVNPMEVLILSPDINITPLMAALLPYVPYQRDLTSKSTDKIAQKLRDFINDHYSEELSLDILSDKMGMSSKYLSRVFKQTIGVNLSDYLAFVRVEKIKELLMTDMSMTQIMESVGVFSRTTFTRMFRRQEGITPSEYRNLHKGVGASEGNDAG